ncbi:hypothetical protein KCP77_04530 [Salmonella enterica subsp. enterica]|nr:hypothetical protein KCP77_04530 [Salmonella enterica subsp. enterica]
MATLFQSSYHELGFRRPHSPVMVHISTSMLAFAPLAAKNRFYADQISLPALEQSAQAARTIVREQNGEGKVKTLAAVAHQPLYTSPLIRLQSASREEKPDILRRADEAARRFTFRRNASPPAYMN